MREETDRPAAATRGRSPFEQFVEAAYQRVSRPPFFFACVAIVVAWLVSLPLWTDTKAWQVAIHTVASVLTLLLVALLENAGRRSAEAAQEKLNVMAEALAALMASRALEDDTLEEAVTRCGRQLVSRSVTELPPAATGHPGSGTRTSEYRLGRPNRQIRVISSGEGLHNVRSG